ncbi:MAG: DNA gyrase modulator, partial [Salaquimonas sp.]
MDSLISTFDVDKSTLERQLADTLKGCDDGELFMEYAQSEHLAFDNGKLKVGNFNTDQGFGLRAVVGEVSAYAHSGEMNLASLKRAADAVSAVSSGHNGTYAAGPARTNRHLYSEENPLASPGFDEKVKLLQEIDAYARAKDPKVRQVSASLGASWQVVEILRADGE